MKGLTREQMTAHSIRRQRERREWLEAQHRRNPRCHYCRCETVFKPWLSSFTGVPEDVLFATLDHVVPRARGGVDHPRNWALACIICNRLKGNMSAKAYIAILKAEGIR